MKIKLCKDIHQEKYPFILPKLPYKNDAFALVKDKTIFSKESFEYHYGKHHKTYVEKLNHILQKYIDINKSVIYKKDIKSISLEEIIIYTFNKDHTLFANAAQTWNHSFFWKNITPHDTKPDINTQKLIDSSFGSMDFFETQFFTIGTQHFGSGWIWLVYNTALKKLEIIATKNAENPSVVFTDNVLLYPISVCDVWEHAYYIDYRNDRAKYLKSFLDYINWHFVNSQLNYIRDELNHKT